MSREAENSGFTCLNCGQAVVPLGNGSYRNHCPFCLWSKHVDIVPGDRRNPCGGGMEPVGLRHKFGKGLQIVHRCLRCGTVSVNKVAESTTQPDDIEAVVTLPCT